VAFADGDFVDGQDAKASIIGWPELFFQKLLVDSFDGFPVQPQMPGDLLDSHDLHMLEHIACQPLGDPQIGVEKLQLFDKSLPAEVTDDFPVQAADPDPGWPKIQVAYPPSLLTVDSPG